MLSGAPRRRQGLSCTSLWRLITVPEPHGTAQGIAGLSLSVLSFVHFRELTAPLSAHPFPRTLPFVTIPTDLGGVPDGQDPSERALFCAHGAAGEKRILYPYWPIVFRIRS